jgi:hypothetical protein
MHVQPEPTVVQEALCEVWIKPGAEIVKVGHPDQTPEHLSGVEPIG